MNEGLVISGIVIWIVGLVFSMFTFGLTVYGLVIAFKVSVILGILALFIQPSPAIIGAAMFFFNYNIPQNIMLYFHK